MPESDAIFKNKPEMPVCFSRLLKQFNEYVNVLKVGKIAWT